MKTIKKYSAALLMVTFVWTLSGQPESRSLNEALVNPPENLQEFVKHLERNSSEEELANRLAILANRLWEKRRYPEAKEICDLAIEKLETERDRPELGDRKKASIHLQMASLNKKVLQDKEKSKTLLEQAKELDPENRLIDRELKRRERKPISFKANIPDVDEG